jgi:co-chaperonin GroES (HSP10)
MKPIKKNVLIEIIKPEEKTSSGLIITGGTGETKFARVIEIGKDVTMVKKDEKVLPDWRHTKDVKYNDKVYSVIHEDNIMAVMDE